MNPSDDKSREVADLKRRLGERERELERRDADLRHRKAGLDDLRRAVDGKTAEAAHLNSQIGDLRESAQRREEELGGQKEELARLRVLLEFSGEAHRQLADLRHSLARNRLRRLIQRILSVFQTLVPELVRAAVRPMYLRLYYRVIAPIEQLVPAFGGAAMADKAMADTIAGETATAAETGADEQSGPAEMASEAAEARGSVSGTEYQAAWVEMYPCYLPKVSVVLPVWNQADLLGESIQSVLNQTYPNLELIVVDDGSTQDLGPVLSQFSGDPRLRLLRRQHEGLPQALNAGFRLAEGDFWTWTSADNVMGTEMLAALLRFLLLNPAVDMTYGDMELISGTGAALTESSYHLFNQRAGASNELRLSRSVETLGLLDDNFIGACFLYRARMGWTLGDYDSALLGTEDYDYWLRMNDLGVIRKLDLGECLYRYRVHDDTLSGRHGDGTITHNVQILLDYQRQRLSFYRRAFDVVILFDAARGVAQGPVAEIAEAMGRLGHRVGVFATNGWEGQEQSGFYEVHLGNDLASIERQLAESRRNEKAVLISFAEDAGSAARLGRGWGPGSAFCFHFVRAEADLAGLDGFMGPGAPPNWILADSNDVAAKLPDAYRRRYSLFIPPETLSPHSPELALKARDAAYPLGDFPDARHPLVVCVAPMDESLLDVSVIRRIAEDHPRIDFVFIASTARFAADPSQWAGSRANVRFLGHKNQGDWHLYLSRAALLLAPFSADPIASPWIQETLQWYLAAGKPILATEAIAMAGFADVPGAMIVRPEDCSKFLADALLVTPRADTTDQYRRGLRTDSAVSRWLAIANNDLFFEKTRVRNRAMPVRQEETETPPPGISRAKSGLSVVLETLTLDRGGLEQVVADMSCAFRDGGVGASICVLEKDGEIAEKCRASGIPTIWLGNSRPKLEALLGSRRPDLWIAHYSNMGASVAARQGIPVVQVVHNSYLWHTAAQDAVIREADPFVTRYVAVSESVKRYFCGKYGVQHEKVMTIPNGLNFTRQEKKTGAAAVTRESLKIPGDCFVFIQVAEFNGTKGQLHAVSALGRAIRRIPNARLLLLGGAADPSYRDLVRDYVREMNLSGHVMFHGHTERVSDYYRLADAFLAPSLIEGWSLAVNEAMYRGLPLLLTRVGSAEEMIEEEDTGITVPAAYEDPLAVNAATLREHCIDPEPRNLSELAEAMVRMAENPAEWKQRGRQGRKKVSRLCGREVIDRRYLQLVDDLLGKDLLAGARSASASA